MHFLIDTHVFLWVMNGDDRAAAVRELMKEESTELHVSAVSWWELAIKARIGKLAVDVPSLRAAAHASGFNELPLTGQHAETLRQLPRIHNDPFDHMLVAQATTEPMRFITADAVLQQYTPLVMLL